MCTSAQQYVKLCWLYLIGFRLKHANKVTRSGPELRRRPSRGTNINPFTPREIQGLTKNGNSRALNQDETWVSTPQSMRDEVEPQKVLLHPFPCQYLKIFVAEKDFEALIVLLFNKYGKN